MTQITPQLLKNLRTEIDNALLEIAKKHNIEIKTGHGSYATNHGSLKLEISAKNESGETISKTAEDFKKYAHLYGFKPEHLGQTFKHGTKVFKISGLNMKARTMPIEATCVETGGGYKFPTTIITLLK